MLYYLVCMALFGIGTHAWGYEQKPKKPKHTPLSAQQYWASCTQPSSPGFVLVVLKSHQQQAIAILNKDKQADKLDRKRFAHKLNTLRGDLSALAMDEAEEVVDDTAPSAPRNRDEDKRPF